MTLTLLITRMRPDAERFAQAISAAWGQPLTVHIEPAFRIEAIDVGSAPQVGDIICTSANGVAQIARLGLAPLAVWCVGDRTAGAAQDAGYQAISARGDADDLVKLILAKRPNGPLLHVAGRDTRGNIADRLTSAGLPCKTLMAYQQVPNAPSAALGQLAGRSGHVVAPVFSPNSALILATQDWDATRHGVAMSPAVADVLTDQGFDTVTTAKAPAEAAMIDATLAVLGHLADRGN